MNVNHVESALLRLISHSLFETENSPALSLQEEEWKSLLAVSEVLGVSVMAFQGALSIDPATLPKYLPDAWSELAFRRSERSERVLAEQALLTHYLHEERIPLLFLADTAAAAYYPAPALRTLKCTDCLCDRPFAKVSIPDTFEFPLNVKHSLAVDQKDALESARIRSMLARALDSVAEKQIGDYTLPVPSIAVQALLLLLEAEKKPSLLLLADWAVLHQYALTSQEINLEMQVRSWEQCGLLPTARLLSLTASIAFSLEKSDWFADADQSEAEALLAKLLTPDGDKLARAQKNLEIAMQHASRPPKVTKVQKVKKNSSEKNSLARFFGGLFKKK